MGKAASLDPRQVRTVALAGHRSSGKTTLAEHLLTTARVVRTPGRVDEGTALLDFTRQERRLRASVRNGYAWLAWGDHRIDLVDTPGGQGACCDRRHALAAVDAVCVVVDATAGPERETRALVKRATRLGLPMMVVLTRADRCHDPSAVWRQMKQWLGERAVQLQLPFYDEQDRLAGVIDVLRGKAVRHAPDLSGAVSVEPLNQVDAERCAPAHEELCEAVAGTDDELIELFLEYFELPVEEVQQGLRAAVADGALIPVLWASGQQGIGGAPLLDAIVDWLPAPQSGAAHPFVAQVVSRHHDSDGKPYTVLRVRGNPPPRKGAWLDAEGRKHTIRKLYQLRGPRRSVLHQPGVGCLVATWDPLAVAAGDALTAQPGVPLPERPTLPPPQLTVSVQEDLNQPLIAAAVARIRQEDPSLQFGSREGVPTIAGLGQMHLERRLEQLRRETGRAFTTSLPPVAYREAPRGSAQEGAVHKRVDGDGLVSEFASCEVSVAPAPGTGGLDYTMGLGAEWDFDLPPQFRPAIERGVRAGALRGPLGHPVVDAHVTLAGGDYNMLCSTEEHFEQAGALALNAALQSCGTFVLEPWSHIQITLDEGALGEVIADLSHHRGRVLSVHPSGDESCIRALCPDSEVRTLAIRLQSMTHGMGRFQATHSHYEPAKGAKVMSIHHSRTNRAVAG